MLNFTIILISLENDISIKLFCNDENVGHEVNSYSLYNHFVLNVTGKLNFQFC